MSKMKFSGLNSNFLSKKTLTDEYNLGFLLSFPYIHVHVHVYSYLIDRID